MTSKSTSTTTRTVPPKQHDDTLPIAAGGVLALLILGGGAAALARRRRENEEWVEEGSMAYEPAEATAAETAAEPAVVHEEQPPIVAPSAFSWGNAENSGETSPSADAVDQEERRPGETWVERAYRGPSPSNPSVSLKTRLRRAAFFDKRERDAAAGLAEPLDPTAGLPRAMSREQEHELA
jgi:hypothetical protein